MPVAYFEPLRRAWTRMQGILFAPFDARKYLAVAFTAWLAGVFENGNGSTGTEWTTDREKWTEWSGGAVDWLAATGAAIVAIYVVLAIAIFALALLWLSSRFKFVFLDNVVRNEGAVKAPWARYASLGNSLFVWRLVFGLVVLILAGGLLISAAAITGVAAGVGLGDVSWLAIAAFVATLVVVVILPALYVSLFLDSFVVPIMYRFGLSASAAWSRFLPLLRQSLFHFLVYGILCLVLNVLVVSVMILAGLFTCCVGFVLMALPFVGTAVTLPVWVTFRAFSLEWIAQLDPELAVLAAPPPPPASP